MREFRDIVRENIRELQAYSCARQEFEGTGVTLLDANENPFASEYNRYPDPFQRELKRGDRTVETGGCIPDCVRKWK